MVGLKTYWMVFVFFKNMLHFHKRKSWRSTKHIIQLQVSVWISQLDVKTRVWGESETPPDHTWVWQQLSELSGEKPEKRSCSDNSTDSVCLWSDLLWSSDRIRKATKQKAPCGELLGSVQRDVSPALHHWRRKSHLQLMSCFQACSLLLVDLTPSPHCGSFHLSGSSRLPSMVEGGVRGVSLQEPWIPSSSTKGCSMITHSVMNNLPAPNHPVSCFI